MSLKPPPTDRSDSELRLTPIRRGWLGGCELYLPPTHRFPLSSGVYERELRHRFDSLASETGCFVDIGAGVGYFTAYFLRRTDARVIAFESDARLADRIGQNAAHNTVRPDRLVIHRTDASNLIGDKLVHHVEGPVFLKIDDADNELSRLRELASLLDREDTRVLVRLRGRRHQDACMRQLDEHGYSVEIVTPAWWRPLLPDASFDPAARWLIGEKRPFEMLPG